MCLDILKFTVENKKKLFRENGFENVVSDLKKKMVYLSLKILLEKSSKTRKNKNKKKTMKTFTIFGGFWGQN